jgi:hypothetical protein
MGISRSDKPIENTSIVTRFTVGPVSSPAVVALTLATTALRTTPLQSHALPYNPLD